MLKATVAERFQEVSRYVLFVAVYQLRYYLRSDWSNTEAMNCDLLMN